MDPLKVANMFMRAPRDERTETANMLAQMKMVEALHGQEQQNMLADIMATNQGNPAAAAAAAEQMGLDPQLTMGLQDRATAEQTRAREEAYTEKTRTRADTDYERGNQLKKIDVMGRMRKIQQELPQQTPQTWKLWRDEQIALGKFIDPDGEEFDPNEISPDFDQALVDQAKGGTRPQVYEIGGQTFYEKPPGSNATLIPQPKYGRGSAATARDDAKIQRMIASGYARDEKDALTKLATAKTNPIALGQQSAKEEYAGIRQQAEATGTPIPDGTMEALNTKHIKFFQDLVAGDDTITPPAVGVKGSGTTSDPYDVKSTADFDQVKSGEIYRHPKDNHLYKKP